MGGWHLVLYYLYGEVRGNPKHIVQKTWVSKTSFWTSFYCLKYERYSIGTGIGSYLSSGPPRMNMCL